MDIDLLFEVGMDLLIIDRHILFREGLVKLLEQQPGLHVIAGTSTATKGMLLAVQHKPQCILIGVDSPTIEEKECIKDICAKLKNCRVVLMFSEEPDGLLVEAIQWGVKGFIPKDTPLSHVLHALQALAKGEMIIPRNLTQRIAEELIRLNGTLKMIAADPGVATLPGELRVELLTPREQEVLLHLGTGASNQEIAREMAISVNTVRVHVHNILEKLELRNRREASRFAVQSSLQFPQRVVSGPVSPTPV